MARRAQGLILFAGLLLAAPALAGDGVREINQACAAVGCFSGDAPGFPVVIDGSAGRSYRLTSDLQVASAAEGGISLRASYLTVDLAGFAIRGVTTCTGTHPITCTPSNLAGDGLAVDDSSREGIEVRNGTVTRMGDTGVTLGPLGRVLKLRLVGNRGNGASVGVASELLDNVSENNGSRGLSAGANCVVRGNSVRWNGTFGIVAGDGCVVRGNLVTNSGDDGVNAGSGVAMVGNVSSANGDGSSTVDDGIECDLGCSVRENSARLNQGVGLRLGADSPYSQSVLTSNSQASPGGPQASGGVNVGENYCGASCP